MNFYPFHIGDYISHTSHLTDEEDLAYRRMIDLYYMTETPLPNDFFWIARRIKSGSVIVETLLKEFFELENDGLWHSSRADKEIAKYQYLSESGKKGAEKRWGNREAKPTNSHPNSPPNATLIATKNQEPRTNSNVAKATKGTRFTLDAIPEEWVLFCKKERSDLNPTFVFEGFKDYWVAVPGLKGVKADWFATWRNWIRNQKSSVVQQVEKVKFI